MTALTIIQEFGGQNAMARTLSCRQSSVWRWANSGRIPSKRIPQIIEAARRLEPPVYLTPNDFFPPVEAPPTTPEAAG